MTLQKSVQADDNFDGVSESGIEQSSKRLPKLHRHLVRSLAKQLKPTGPRPLSTPLNQSTRIRRAYFRKGHDRNETEPEAQRRIPLESMRNKRERCEDEKDVEPRSKEEESEGGKPAGFALCFDEFDGAFEE